MMRAQRFQRGASIIEFGLVAFVLFMMMWGILEFGRAFYVRNSTQHLTRCIAREAVTRAPSKYADAKQACLMSSGGAYFWPFFQLSGSDMQGLFTVQYCFKDHSQACVVEPTTTYLDDQVALCQEGDTQCVETVEVCLQDNYVLQEFGILRAIMRIGGNIKEPKACTTMPAESMGLDRP